MSAKTKSYFTTAVALWDADFYVKVDDDVHVNIGKRYDFFGLSFGNLGGNVNSSFLVYMTKNFLLSCIFKMLCIIAIVGNIFERR